MDITQFNFIQFTADEAARFTELQALLKTQTEIFYSLAEELLKAEGEEAEQIRAQMQSINSETIATAADFAKINAAAEERYYKSFSDAQAILNDARKVLAAASKEDYEQQEASFYESGQALIEYIEKNKDRLSERELSSYTKQAAKLSETPELNYTGYVSYLISCTRLQLKALDYNSFDKMPLIELIEAQAAEAYEPPEEQLGQLSEQAIAEILIKAKQAPLDNVELAVDKVNVNFINILKDEPEGQIALFDIDTIMANPKKPEPLVTVSVDFTGLEENITRSISYFDKRVMTAINTLWENGETQTTLSRVYIAMGGKARPAASDIDKIKNSIIKQMSILLKLSNQLEIERGYNYDAIEYAGNLLKVEIVPIIKNGKAVEGGILIYGKPPLIDFAKKRNQITTIPLKMLQAPINKTERNLAIEDYIQFRVCREEHQAKEAAIQKYKEYTRSNNSKASKNISIDKKLLYSTIFENTSITNRTQQFRAKETIQRIFDFYAEANIKNITACKYEADAVKVTYTFTPEQITQAIALKKQKR